MNNAKKIAEELDRVAEGFKRVPVVALPPKIKWGDEFLAWDDQKKIDWLKKFAEAMNHAADTIMKERDDLGRLCELKEAQLQQMQETVDNNNLMLQSEITKMNSYKQEVSAHCAKLNARIRELEG